MEEKMERPHQAELTDRSRGRFTGVVDVDSFDTEKILLETTGGRLSIRGRELHVSRLELSKGELDVEGTVDSLTYSDGGAHGKKKGSLAARLFG